MRNLYRPQERHLASTGELVYVLPWKRTDRAHRDALTLSRYVQVLVPTPGLKPQHLPYLHRHAQGARVLFSTRHMELPRRALIKVVRRDSLRVEED